MFNDIGARTAGSTLTVNIAGRGGVPADATAVSLNVTATNPQGPGFITVYPCGNRPNTSNLNYTAGQTIANAGDHQTRGQRHRVPVHLRRHRTHRRRQRVTFLPMTGYGAVAPGRVSRRPGGPGLSTIERRVHQDRGPGAGSALAVTVAGRAGVPADATAVSVERHRHRTGRSGFMTVYPCGSTAPTPPTSTTPPAQTIANATIAKLATNGTVCLFTYATTHLIVDVNGYYPPTTSYVPSHPPG